MKPPGAMITAVQSNTRTTEAILLASTMHPSCQFQRARAFRECWLFALFRLRVTAPHSLIAVSQV